MKEASEYDNSCLFMDGTNIDDDYRGAGRSLFWRMFLLKRTLDLNLVSQQVEIGRIQYDTLRTRFQCDRVLENSKFKETHDVNEDDKDELNSNPLDKIVDDNLDASNLEEQGELKQLVHQISQDINRAFPDMSFFRDSEVQIYLFRILYVYSKLNPDLSYRQGMHELAGPILYVVMKDALIPSTIEKAINTQEFSVSRNISFLLDSNYVEHDAYLLFNTIMQVAHEWYAVATPQSSSVPIIDKAQYIQSHILRIADAKLERTLSLAAIEPQLWAIKWIRLLFGREFPFQFTLHLWDTLFAVDGNSLVLVDYICAVLLLRIRWKIVASSEEALANEGPTPDDILITIFKYPLYGNNENDGKDQDLPTVTEPWRIVSHAMFLKSHLTPDAGKFIRDQYSHLWRKPITKDKLGLSRPSSSQLPSVLSSASESSKNLRDFATKISQSKEWYALDKFFREKLEEVKSKAADYDIQDVVNNPSTVIEFIKDRINIEPAVASKQQPDPVKNGNQIELKLLSMVENYQASVQEKLDSRNMALSKLLSGALISLNQTVSVAGSGEVILELNNYKNAISHIIHVKECLDDASIAPNLNLVEGNDPLGNLSLSASSDISRPSSPSKYGPSKKSVALNAISSRAFPVVSRSDELGTPVRVSLAQSEFSWMLNSPQTIPRENAPPDLVAKKESLMDAQSRSSASSPIRQTSTRANRLSGLFNRKTNRKIVMPPFHGPNESKSSSDPTLTLYGNEAIELL
ncbi:RabGAP/TBC [Nadsonia fulvescens var. elongata DSM 6958]|uniref:RabGAP/TBC n=1 Tax=Nadsonia fulvescens var. elongata DSM 6958 TaxID=857566 RepID=A0A1E3PNN0_9ASCO|nr:RabGAP/TBC [Nadsonia fulvescens var. elongata DSM 6958]